MKYFIQFVLVIILSLGMSLSQSNTLSAQSETKNSVIIKTDKSKTVHFEVSGMTCQKGCADGIDKKLKKVAGVISSKTEAESGISKITFDEKLVSAEQLTSIITEHGYPAKIANKQK